MLHQREIYESPSLSGDIAADISVGTWLQDDISSANLEYADRKYQLSALIEQMREEGGPSWDSEPAVVDAEVVETALRLLRSLPLNRELPKVAPDGEGDLLFVWEPPRGNCIVTVERNTLHLVDCPGTKYSVHIDDQPFTGSHIPISILQALPMR